MSRKKEKTEKLIKSKTRVDKFGEVFTPTDLVNEMIEQLPKSIWNKNKTFLEPSCGDGNFLVVILRKKIEYNHHPLTALKSIYGVDIMEDNVRESRKRLLEEIAHSLSEEEIVSAVKIIKSNIKLGDTLKQTLEEIFGH